MGRITDIRKQMRNKSRVSIFIDGEFACGLDELAAASARLKVGDEITPEELVSVMRGSELNSAFERAVAYLSLMPRARREIERYLRDKEYAPDIVGEVIEKLDGYHYIDDRAYAAAYVRSKSKKYGSFRIASELRQKGIAQEIISELLDESADSNVVEVARKYLASHKSADRQKLKRFLAGRGFSWDSIAAAVAELSGELGGDDNYDDNDD